MSKKFLINKGQDKKGFFKGMKQAYEKFINKETIKMAKIREMIKTFNYGIL